MANDYLNKKTPEYNPQIENKASKENAFVKENNPQPTGFEKPQFVEKTPGLQKTGDENGFHFNFVGVRSFPDETK